MSVPNVLASFLRKYIYRHKKDSQKLLIPLIFSNYDRMKHQKTHSDVKPFICSVCNKDFRREALLRRHETIHTQTPKYMCTQCEDTYVVKEDLDKHMRKHEKRRCFSCTECRKSFVFKQVGIFAMFSLKLIFN